uniref:Flp family type IVb pilin n=1 Tax=Desulfobacca acetoxidans TaxID=60893 RepID=A0A7C5ALI6_9BACT
MSLHSQCWRLLKTDEGAASVEYALLLAGVTLAIFLSVMGLGQVVLAQLYERAANLFPHP